MAHILEVRDVGHDYATAAFDRTRVVQKTVLQKIDLLIPAGQMVAVMGPSGCGKTTLLLACGGMLPPTRGQVLIDGHDVYRLPLAGQNRLRRCDVGYLFQTLELIPYLNVLENVLVVPGSNRQQAISWLERLGLGPQMEQRPGDMSHGQRQRAALVRALVGDPKLLIADEPSGNLDRENTAVVVQVMREFADRGGAVLVATHDSRIAGRADQSWEIEEGFIRPGRVEIAAI